MFTRILVVTDLSKASAAMLPCLGALKRLGALEAVLLHCVNVRDAGAISDSLRDELAGPLLEQCQTLASLGFHAEYELVAGLTQIEVNEVARRRGSTLAVVGSHGEGVFGDTPLGGVVGSVIQGARLPVLIIRLLEDAHGTRACHVATGGLLSHVLHATDFSDNAERAFYQVEKLARGGAERITLLHVQEHPRMIHMTPGELQELDRLDRIRLHRLRERLLRDRVCDAQSVVLHGSPAHEIAHYAAETDASLIVLGNQGRGYIGELFLGSVSRQLARQAHCSVLLIPHPL